MKKRELNVFIELFKNSKKSDRDIAKKLSYIDLVGGHLRHIIGP